MTGSYRRAILSLVVLFVLGLALLVGADTDRAVVEARLASTPAPDRPADEVPV